MSPSNYAVPSNYTVKAQRDTAYISIMINKEKEKKTTKKKKNIEDRGLL